MSTRLYPLACCEAFVTSIEHVGLQFHSAVGSCLVLLSGSAGFTTEMGRVLSTFCFLKRNFSGNSIPFLLFGRVQG